MTANKSTVEYWLKNIVIDLDLCPFARLPYKRGVIRLSESLEIEEDERFDVVFDEVELLLNSSASVLQTTLLFFPELKISFENFYEECLDLQEMLDEANLKERMLLVCFHPDFRFENAPADDVGNLVNRSPYPLIHLIRATDFKGALANPNDGEIIANNNYEKLKKMDLEELEKLFYYLKW